MFASANAAKSLLQCAAHALASGVASSNTGRFSVAGLDRDVRSVSIAYAPAVLATGSHLGAAIAKPLVVFQGFFNGIRGLAFTLEVVWVIFLIVVSKG